MLLLHANAFKAFQCMLIPRTQGELIRTARGDRTQKAFALELQVEKSLLSRYESEKLGAPTSVINHCLSFLADAAASTTEKPVDRALEFARRAVNELERIARLDEPGGH